MFEIFIKARIYISIIMLGWASMVFAQGRGDFRYYAQINTIASDGEYAPFWFTANNNAISSVKKSSGYIRYGMSYCNSFDKKGNLRYNVVADILTGFNQTTTIYFQQAYGEVSWKWLTLSIGSKERWSEQEYFQREYMLGQSGSNIVNSYYPNLFHNRFGNLGTGGLIFSGNSRPIPQIRIEIPEFLNIPGTKEWLKIRAYISYGIFSDGKFQEEFTQDNPKAKYGKNILYHGKAGFIKIGNPSKFPLIFDGGLEMHTQFGGTMYRTAYSKNPITMPTKFMDFIKAFIPMSGGESTPTDEQTNISGNQIGCWHAAFTLHTKPLDVRQQKSNNEKW